MAGNPCYVLTITDNVQEDDIKIDGKGNKCDDKAAPSSTNRGVSTNRNQAAPHGGLSFSKHKSDPLSEGNENKEESTLSGFHMAAKNQKEIDANQKQTIFLTARVHPGESNASFMI